MHTIRRLFASFCKNEHKINASFLVLFYYPKFEVAGLPCTHRLSVLYCIILQGSGQTASDLSPLLIMTEMNLGVLFPRIVQQEGNRTWKGEEQKFRPLLYDPKNRMGLSIFGSLGILGPTYPNASIEEVRFHGRRWRATNQTVEKQDYWNVIQTRWKFTRKKPIWVNC